ncbi:hypothetical protein HK096_003703, partial [Nowakowskiella sp. JEL0078]
METETMEVRFSNADLRLYRKDRNMLKRERVMFLQVIETVNGGVKGGINVEQNANIEGSPIRVSTTPKKLHRPSLDTLVEEEEDVSERTSTSWKVVAAAEVPKVHISLCEEIEQIKISETSNEIETWLVDNGFYLLVDIFKKEEITDWNIMGTLDLHALKLMGLTVGTSLRVLTASQKQIRKSSKLQIPKTKELTRHKSLESHWKPNKSQRHPASVDAKKRDNLDDRPPWNDHFGAIDQMPRQSRPSSAIYIPNVSDETIKRKLSHSRKSNTNLKENTEISKAFDNSSRFGRFSPSRPRSPLSRNV